MLNRVTLMMLTLTVSLTVSLIATLGLSGSAQAAQDTALNLADVLERAPTLDADVIVAEADLAAAERELRRTEGDPLALRLPRLEAEQRVASERANLTSTRLEAQGEAASRYFDALEADDTLNLARERLEIAQATAEAAQIRYDAGQIDNLELTRAQNDLASAEREVSSAEQGRTFAYGDLASLLGLEVEGLQLVAPFAPPPIPPLGEVLARLDENAALQRAAQGVAVAKVRLELANSAYTPERDVEAARDALASAQTQQRELRRSLELSVRGAYNAALAARDVYKNAQAALTSAESELAAQRLRFEAGDVSRLTLAETERSAAQSAAALRSAQYALAEAVTRLDLAVRGAGQGGTSNEVQSE